MLACIYNFGSVADWALALITLFGIIIALVQFDSYRKEIKNNTFVEFRQRFKSDSINIKVFKYLFDQNEKLEIPTEYEFNHFLGFSEELHKMYVDRQISIDDIIYFFGIYFVKFFENENAKNKVKITSNYWTRAVALYREIKENENKVLSKISSDFKHKENLTYINNK